MKAQKIEEILSQIYKNTGLTLEEKKPSNKLKYFDVEIPEGASEWVGYPILIRFSNQYKTIRVEPNGLKTLAIYPLV